MVLAGLALLCWPSRPLLRVSSRVGFVGRPGGRRPGWFGRLPAGRSTAGRSTRWPAGRPGGVLGVVGVSAAALPAGVVASCATLLVTGTVTLLTSAELRRRRDSRQTGSLLVATRTLAREVRTGAAPVAAVLATAAAHPGCAAALEQLAAAVAGRRGGSVLSPGPDSGPASGVDSGLGSGRLTGRAAPAGRGAGGRVDRQAETMVRLGDGWELSARYGVPWAALVETVATDLAERQRAESLRNAQVAGPRVSGYVLAVMPALGILLGAGMGADPVHVLLHTGVGAVLLSVGAALTCLGLAWTAAIVRP